MLIWAETHLMFPCDRVSAQVASRHRGLAVHDIARSTLRDDTTPFDAAARAHINDPVSATDQVQVVLDDEDRRSALNEVLEHVQEDLHIIRVQADRRLVEDEESALLAPTHFGGKLEALGLAT